MGAVLPDHSENSCVDLICSKSYQDQKLTFQSCADNRPDISFIVMSYNNAAFLQECLESVGNQDFDSYEIIIGDDGSVDQSRNIIESFVLDTNRQALAILSQKNTGIVSNYNRCLLKCNGKFIAHIASDDVSERNRLRLQFNAMRQSGSSMCVTSLSVINESGRVLRKRELRDGFIETSASGIKKGRISLPSPTMMYEKTLIDKYGLLPSHLFNEDEVLGVRAFSEAGVYSLSASTVRYRKHGSSVTSKGNVISIGRFLEWQCHDIPHRIANVREYIAIVKRSDYKNAMVPSLQKKIRQLEAAAHLIKKITNKSGLDEVNYSNDLLASLYGIKELISLYAFGLIRFIRNRAYELIK